MQVTCKQKLFYLFFTALVMVPLYTIARVVNTNLILEDSVSVRKGNVMKKVANGVAVRFINNYGTNNTFVGIESGSRFTSRGNDNSGFGTSTLTIVTLGSNNTAVGADALKVTREGSGNVGVGAFALLANTDGVDNTVVGTSAFQFSKTTMQNVAIGRAALNKNISGTRNVAVGSRALLINEDGSDNTAIGTNAGLKLKRLTGLFAKSDRNIFLGSSSGMNLTYGTNNIYIGSPDQSILGVEESNAIRIGKASEGGLKSHFIQGIHNVQLPFSVDGPLPVYFNADGQLGVITSSRRFKHAINKVSDELGCIDKLRPVIFAYDQDETKTRQFGLIAQEVDAVFPELVVYEDGVPYSVRYDILPVLLIDEIQKRKQDLQLRRQDITALQQIVRDLQEKVKTFMQN